MKTILSLVVLGLSLSVRAEVKPAGTFIPRLCSDVQTKGAIPLNPIATVCEGVLSEGGEDSYFEFTRLYGGKILYRVLNEKVAKNSTPIPGGQLQHIYTMMNVETQKIVKMRVATQALPPRYSYIRSITAKDGTLTITAENFERVSTTQGR